MWNQSPPNRGYNKKTPWPTVRTTEDIPSVRGTTRACTRFRQGEATEENATAGLALQYTLEKIDISRTYTVAPAYNKGAYQVISKEHVKYIGK